jgi:cytochrome c553
MKKGLSIILFLGLWSLAAADGAALYKQCVTCHGANGEKPALGKSKVIKGMSKADVVAAMKGYKAGTFGGSLKSVMEKQVATLSDAQIDEVSAYVSQMK